MKLDHRVAKTVYLRTHKHYPAAFFTPITFSNIDSSLVDTVHLEKTSCTAKITLNVSEIPNASVISEINKIIKARKSPLDLLTKCVILEGSSRISKDAASPPVFLNDHFVAQEFPDGAAPAPAFNQEKADLLTRFSELGKIVTIALWNGSSRGFGTALAASAHFSISTCNSSAVLMDYTSDAYLPVHTVFEKCLDMDRSLGLYLLLSGDTLFGEDLFLAGLSNRHVPFERLADLTEHISSFEDPSIPTIHSIIANYHDTPTDNIYPLEHLIDTIDTHFKNKTSVPQIIASLRTVQQNTGSFAAAKYVLAKLEDKAMHPAAYIKRTLAMALYCYFSMPARRITLTHNTLEKIFLQLESKIANMLKEDSNYINMDLFNLSKESFGEAEISGVATSVRTTPTKTSISTSGPATGRTANSSYNDLYVSKVADQYNIDIRDVVPSMSIHEYARARQSLDISEYEQVANTIKNHKSSARESNTSSLDAPNATRGTARASPNDAAAQNILKGVMTVKEIQDILEKNSRPAINRINFNIAELLPPNQLPLMASFMAAASQGRLSMRTNVLKFHQVYNAAKDSSAHQGQQNLKLSKFPNLPTLPKHATTTTYQEPVPNEVLNSDSLADSKMQETPSDAPKQD